EDDVAPFDSVPGVGFDTSPAAAAIVPPAGSIAGAGPVLLVDPAQNNAFRAINRAWRQGASVGRAGAKYAIAGLSEAAQTSLAHSLALTAERIADARTDPMRNPRIGLYQPWSGSMDEGWTRWILEQYGFPFVTLHPEDFHKPLADRVDV